MLEFRAIPQTRLSGPAAPRHAHREPYAALVLEGGYEEAGEAGRWRVEPGEVVCHAPFACHVNWLPSRTVRVLNLPLPAWTGPSAVLRVDDPDLLLRLAKRDPRAAADALLAIPAVAAPARQDAPDLLAEQLTAAPPALRDWAAARGVCRQTAFRWFRAAYGVSPARFRVEARARSAWRRLVESRAPLAEVALEAGFADQPHMSREVKAFTGLTPRQWRERSLQPSSLQP